MPAPTTLRSQRRSTAWLAVSITLTLLCAPCYAKRQDAGDDDDKVRLKLCDCAPADGAPGGLSCSKEGFFVAGFERQGQWVAGGGAVPLSRAICCRPCLPDNYETHFPELLAALSTATATATTSASTDDDEDDGNSPHPVAVVSLGCHSSTDTLGLRCESTANSFVSGFTEAVKVFTTPSLYPINSVSCCSPALLTDKGDAWQLERCGCHSSEDVEHSVSCGGDVTGELLTGFDYFRLSPVGSIVPIGPAKCCGVCLSKSSSSRPAADCADLNRCSGNGVCSLGRCECRQAWGGADCSMPLAGGRGSSRIPPWAVALIVIGSCLLAIAILAASAHIAEALFESRNGNGINGGGGGVGSSLRRALLLHRNDDDDEDGEGDDDAGSVGSQDTECDEDLEEVEERIEGAINRLEQTVSEVEGAAESAGAGEGGDVQIEVEVEPLLANTTTSQEQQQQHEEEEEEEVHVVEAQLQSASAAASASHGNDGGSGSGGGDIEAPAPPPPPPPSSTNNNHEQDDNNDSKPPRGSVLDSYAGIGPLASVDCSVCMIRPVQTVIVPCGHVCLCRRCSRRLQRCPICRVDIVRRQRLFV